MLDLGTSNLCTVADGQSDVWIRCAAANLGRFQTTSIVDGDLKHTNSGVCEMTKSDLYVLQELRR